MSQLITQRLILRPYQSDDLDLMVPMYADPDVTAYTKLGRCTYEQTAAVLRGYLDLWDERQFGMRAMLRRDDGHFVGECGAFLLASGDAALRYALMPAAWGLGFAPEAVQATADDLFRRVGLARIWSIIQARNISSCRVMEKAGWQIAHTSRDGNIDLVVFRQTIDQWRSNSPTNSE